MAVKTAGRPRAGSSSSVLSLSRGCLDSNVLRLAVLEKRSSSRSAHCVRRLFTSRCLRSHCVRIPAQAGNLFSNDKSRYKSLSDKPAHLFDTAVKIWSDSKLALAQAAKPDHWVVDKLRHIRTAFFFFKSYVRSAQLQLCSVSGNDNPADIFTKGFGAPGKTAANQKSEVSKVGIIIRKGKFPSSAFQRVLNR